MIFSNIIIILDFSKAFDKVSHSLLLSKLHGMGVAGSVHKWISAFLTNRMQQIVVNGEFSSEALVTSGMPQVLALIPLLFLCYINNLPDCIKSQVCLFADNSLQYRAIANMNDVFILQKDLHELETWG